MVATRPLHLDATGPTKFDGMFSIPNAPTPRCKGNGYCGALEQVENNAHNNNYNNTITQPFGSENTTQLLYWDAFSGLFSCAENKYFVVWVK